MSIFFSFIISIVIFTILIIVGQVKELVTSCTSPYSASEGSHAVVVCTEWDEFKTLNWKKVATMRMILTTIMIHDLENVKVIRIIMWCNCYNLNILPFWCNCFQHLKDVIMCHISPDIRGNDETGLCLWWWGNSIYQIVSKLIYKLNGNIFPFYRPKDPSPRGAGQNWFLGRDHRETDLAGVELKCNDCQAELLAGESVKRVEMFNWGWKAFWNKDLIK